MKVRLTRRAVTELDKLLAYINSRSPGGARSVRKRLEATFTALESNPGLGRQTSNLRLRQIAATPYPYIVYYEWAAAEVVVIGIRHTARDPSSMPGH